MNSLEFIEKEIEDKKENVKHWEKQLERYPNDEVFTRGLDRCKEQLQTLQKIKTQLEAWEICKKHHHINKYEDINKGRDKKRFDITIWLNTENCDFKSCASYEECLKVKNALEVEE